MSTPLAPVSLRTARLCITTAVPADAAAVVDYLLRNRDYHASTSPLLPADYYDVGAWQRRIEGHAVERERATALRLLLRAVDDIDGPVIGLASFTNIVWGHFRACYLGYAIDQRVEGRGLMPEALAAALEHVFGVLRLHRVMANHLPENHRSAAVLQRLGFVREGLAPAYLYINGGWRDHVLTAKTSPYPSVPEV